MSDDLIERLRRERSNADENAEFLAEAADRIEELERWNAEGLTVLTEWENVWERAGRPGSLGSSKALAVGHRIAELETVLADVVGWLDRTGRKGCAHTEHARRALDGER